jgi:hypothetical protein
MKNAMTKFSAEIQAKMKDVETRLESLKATMATQADHADQAIRAQIGILEDDAQKAKGTLERARDEMSTWVEDAKDTVIGWKDQLNASMLHARADRSDRYAEAALVVALAGVDQAQKAMLSASVARSDAEAIKQAA